MKTLIRNLLPSQQWIPVVIIVMGIGTGLIAYLLYVSKPISYLSDDPKTCVNCHVMAPFYDSWQHSSHAHVTTCNDCHVPHTSVAAKYFFKAKDGLNHASIFTMRGESQVPRIKEAGSNVVQRNCQRCHDDLNAMVSTKGTTLESREHGEGKLCWDCHREVPHGRVHSLSASPDANVPLPESPVPDWLKSQTKESNTSK